MAIYAQTFGYYHNADRVKSDFTVNGTNNRIRYYISDYEVQQDGAGTIQINYISSPVGLSIMVVTINGDETINYVYTDHLGTPSLITDENAIIIAKQSYDVWGRPRNADDWLLTTTPSITNPTWLWRGYKGHEMMTEFALINMNARLYDYINGRMCEPDVATSGGTQGYNRYSYARNNPMRFNDPSGNHPLLVAALVGGLINVALNFNNINNNAQLFGYFAVGALGGLAGAGIGGALTGLLSSVGFISGSIVGASSGFAGGFIGGAGNSMLQGGDEGQVLSAGLKGGLTGALFAGITNGLAGGISAVRQGRDFWSGKTPIEQALIALRRNSSKWGDGANPNPITLEEGLALKEQYFPNVKGLNKFTIGNQFFKDENFKALGATVAVNGTPSADVYIHTNALGDKMLYLEVIGHEFIHVNQFYTGQMQYWAATYGMDVANELAEKAAFDYSLNFYQNNSGFMIEEFSVVRQLSKSYNNYYNNQLLIHPGIEDSWRYQFYKNIFFGK